MRCYTAAGKEIINEYLRRYAGHSSVYLNYHDNGQISKAEYSSAPDGGIQFYHVIYKFDEAGNLTDKMDLSQPDGHPVLSPEMRMVVKPEVSKPKSNECAIPFVSHFFISNQTGKKVRIRCKARQNLYVALHYTLLMLKPLQTIVKKEIAQSLSVQKQHCIAARHTCYCRSMVPSRF